MKNNAKSIIVLTVICLVVATLLGVVSHVTSPIIAEANEKATSEACAAVMPGAGSFTEVDISDLGLASSVTSVFKSDLGYVFKITTKGYDSGLVVMCGISLDGKITGATILSSNETPSLGGMFVSEGYNKPYTGKQASELDEIDAKSGATLTSNGFKGACKTAFEAFSTITGQGGNN